jgi:transcriptional regulator with GAF, ATPase, and Fis domain
MPEGEKPAEPVDSVQTGTVLTTTQMQQLERDNIHLALRQCKWRVAGKDGAARLLGMPPSTLQSRMKALGIERPG